MGLLAFILNYIPTIGSFFALLPPALLALVQFGFVETIVVAIGFIIINTLVGNIIEPRFMGPPGNMTESGPKRAA